MPGDRAQGRGAGVVSVDEGERASGFAHGALRVLSRVARNSVKRNFGAVRCAFDGGSRTANLEGDSRDGASG